MKVNRKALLKCLSEVLIYKDSFSPDEYPGLQK